MSDPRWAQLVLSIQEIFERGAGAIPFNHRLDAAETLGRFGDPRLTEERRVWLPGGSFLMGSDDKDAYDDEKPVHRVTVKGFWIARYPVTVAEYTGFVDDRGYSRRELWSAGGFGEFAEPREWMTQRKHPNRPVTRVSWFEAAAFSAWRGARLLTEAEWEYAARGASGRKYAWGNQDPSPELANFPGGPRRPTPVGLYPEGQTPEGLFDMAGNVWEWVSDWYSTYPSSAQEDPRRAAMGSGKVLRGGSWNNNPRSLRGACRNRDAPAERSGNVGFRLAWDGKTLDA